MRQVLAAGLVAVILVGAVDLAVDAQVSADVLDQAIIRAVHLLILAPVGGELKIAGNCSGAFVTGSGVILTASHCVRATKDIPQIGIVKGQLYHPEGLVVVETITHPDRVKPVPALVANLIGDEPALDMALLKTTAHFRGREAVPLPPNFFVPHLAMGNSDTVRHGEPIAVVGYPGVGGNTVTVNLGTVAGFTVDDQDRKLEMKLDAQAGPGSSGAPVVNARGEQVAVYWGAIAQTDRPDVKSGRATLSNRLPSGWRQQIAQTSGTPPASGVSGPSPTASGVLFRGVVNDADTGIGIGGVNVIVLRPGTVPRSATGADVLVVAQTDDRGFYRTARSVPKGAEYPVVVLAKGYQPLEGFLNIKNDDPDIITIEPIRLRR